MEAILRVSTALEAAVPRSRPAESPVPVLKDKPQIALPLGFMITGVLALAGALLWFILRPEILSTYHYNQYVIAATHLVVLGFVSSVIMGAMYQLAPVALETRLFSRKLAWVQFGTHVICVAGMVYMFARWDMKQVGHFGSGYALAAGLFAYNIVRTVWRGRRGSVAGIALGLGMFWLMSTVTAGLIIAAGKCSYDSASVEATGALGATLRFLRSSALVAGRFDQIGAMHAHAHLGIVGFFLTVLVGVSYKLVPMFVLGEIRNQRRALASVLLISGGLGAVFVAILLRTQWKPIAALVVCLGLVLYGWEMRAILKARRRRALDWSLRTFFAGLLCLVPLGLLGLVLSWPGLPLNTFTGQLENLYGLLALLGLLALAIMGMLHKVIPFLVWYSAYSPHIGRIRVPLFNDLFSTRLQVASVLLYVAGLIGVSAGVMLAHALAVQIASALLLTGVLLLLVNIGIMLSHAVQPRLVPFNYSTK